MVSITQAAFCLEELIAAAPHNFLNHLRYAEVRSLAHLVGTRAQMLENNCLSRQPEEYAPISDLLKICTLHA